MFLAGLGVTFLSSLLSANAIADVNSGAIPQATPSAVGLTLSKQANPIDTVVYTRKTASATVEPVHNVPSIALKAKQAVPVEVEPNLSLQANPTDHKSNIARMTDAINGDFGAIPWDLRIACGNPGLDNTAAAKDTPPAHLLGKVASSVTAGDNDALGEENVPSVRLMVNHRAIAGDNDALAAKNVIPEHLLGKVTSSATAGIGAGLSFITAAKNAPLAHLPRTRVSSASANNHLHAIGAGISG